MSLWGHKTKTFVSTSISRMIPDEMLPNSAVTGAIRSLLGGQMDIAESIQKHMLQSIAIKAERMFKYGKDQYPYGLPEAKIYTQNTDAGIVQRVIEREEGRRINLEYYRLGPFNDLHAGWKLLTEQYGYDGHSNEIKGLSEQKRFKVYLEDMYVVLPKAKASEYVPSSLESWGTPARCGYTPLRPTFVSEILNFTRTIMEYSPYGFSDSIDEPHVRVEYIYTEEKVSNGIYSKTHKREHLLLPVICPDVSKDYFQVKYYWDEVIKAEKEDEPDQTIRIYKYFTYSWGEGRYPEIDVFFDDKHQGYGEFFPFGYFRFDRTAQNKDKSSQEYRAGKKLTKYLGMDFNDVVDAIHENPDIADVEQAMMMMAVPPDSKNPIECRYLFEFFKRIYEETGAIGLPIFDEAVEIAPYQPENGSEQYSPDKINFTIKDKRFTLTLNFTGMRYQIKEGKIAPVGSHASVKAEKLIKVRRVEFPENEAHPVEYNETYTVPYYAFQKQTSESTYEEYVVSDLFTAYHIWGDFAATSDDQGEILLIPLDASITREYSNPDREELYARSLHFVFNARKTIKLKWYQQEWFRAVMAIVAIVITIYSMGSTGGSEWQLALAAGEYGTAAVIAFEALAIAVAVNVAMKFIAKLLGAEAAAILAVVLMVYAAYSGYQAGGIKNAPFAAEMLQTANGLMKAAGDVVADSLLGLKKEAEAFGTMVEEKTKLLDEANSLLEGQNILSPFVIFGESASMYYERTVHSGNIGVLSIDAISSYVDLSLKLPTLASSLPQPFMAY